MSQEKRAGFDRQRPLSLKGAGNSLRSMTPPLKMKKKVGHISSTAPCRPLSPVKLAVARQILSTKLLFDVTF